MDERISSVLQQTFQDFEIIILDDCSTDNSRAIIEQWLQKDERISFYPNEVNSGSPFFQWNKGATLAQGEYLWIAESDDIAEPTLLENLVELLDKNPQVGIAFAQSDLVDENSNYLHSYNEHYQFAFKSDRWESDFIASGKMECEKYLLITNTIPNASAALFRKDIFIKAGGPNPKWKLNGDWFFYAQMLMISDLAFCSKTLNHFRKHTDTQRQRSNENPLIYWEILHLMDYIIKHTNPDPKDIKWGYNNVSRWWSDSLYRQNIKSPHFKDNLKLFKFFFSKNPKIALIIPYEAVIKLLIGFLKIIGLKKPLKQLLSTLFPGKFFKY